MIKMAEKQCELEIVEQLPPRKNKGCANADITLKIKGVGGLEEVLDFFQEQYLGTTDHDASYELRSEPDSNGVVYSITADGVGSGAAGYEWGDAEGLEVYTGW